MRTYIDDNKHISNKRIKISHDEPPYQTRQELRAGLASQEVTQSESVDASKIRWINQDELQQLLDEYQEFAVSIAAVWDAVQNHASRQSMNKALHPLVSALADNPTDRALVYGPGHHDLCELFFLQFQRVFKYLDQIYEIGTIVKLRDRNDIVPPDLQYELHPNDYEELRLIKDFLSAAALPTIVTDLLQMGERSDTKVPFMFMDRIILDIESILHNIPAPSFVASSRYLERLRDTFPVPDRTDLETHLLLPGSFPDTDEPEHAQEEPDKADEPLPTLPNEPSAVDITPPSPAPVINEKKYMKIESLHDQLASTMIAEITAEQYNANFYHESNVHRAIKKTYITDFEPKSPLKSVDVRTIQSILKVKKRDDASKRTPKRLRMSRAPKTVRFSESTLSPQPRTHMGLGIPKIIPQGRKAKVCKPDPRWKSPERRMHLWFDPPKAKAEEALSEDVFLSPRTRLRNKHQQGTSIDASKRIDELFSIPSELPLAISDDTKAGIAIRKEQAALKAAEEARRAEEAARRAAEEKAQREREERLAKSGGLRIPAQPFVAPLGAAWQAKAQATMRAPASESLAKTGEGVDLHQHDFFKVVSPKEWLNDEIVNGSLNWLDQAINSAAGIKCVKRSTRKCLALSSFFFKRLQDQGVARTQRTLRRYGVDKRNFTDIDTILLPICENMHWTLLVIRPSKRTVAHMDSLRPAAASSQYIDIGLAWIQDVLEDTFQADEWKVISHQAPRQTNGYDCGVHTITNAMCLALGLSPIDSYRSRDMPEQRIRIACMLLNGGFKGEFDLRLY